MKRLLLVCLVLPIVALADDPFACVDPEFANAFLGTNFVDPPVYSTDLLDAFDDLTVPDSYALIGSSSNSYSLRAVYRKLGDGEQHTLGDIVEIIENDGWRDVRLLSRSQSRGFQHNWVGNSAQLCRDKEPGLLSISLNDSVNETYLSLSMSNYSQGQTCAALEAQSKFYSGSGMSLMQELPNLKFPDDAQSSGGGSGGGGNSYHSDAVVETDIGRAGLMGHLGDQIRDQGWVSDTSWSGNLSSGSVWSKKSSDDQSLVGMLHAYGDSPTIFHVRFSVTTNSPGKFARTTGVGFGRATLN